MDTYANMLLIAIPIFFVSVLLEALYGNWIKDQKHNFMDTISSLSSGITNLLYDLLGLGIIIVSYSFLYDYIMIFSIQESVLLYIVAFICIDFASYCHHYLKHSVNIFWNQHVIHHSSEEFNLACALRQSITNNLGVGILFLLPAALCGVPPKVISIIAPLHLFGQFWYHTRHIGKLGFLEYIIVTPSQHRVHHAINPEYIDKNLGAIFCVWDRAFGTFQEELEDVPPVYGVKRPLRSWNPILINFSHLFQLIKDAWRTNNILDKFRIWFMPTGWRPKDVILKYPLNDIESPYDYKKYYPKLSESLKLWSWVQFGIIFLFIMYYINHLHLLLFRDAILFAIFLFTCVYSLTSLMDKENNSWIFELIKASFGTSLILFSSNWTFMNEYITNADFIIMIYFILSLIVVLYFNKEEIQLKSNS